ncbi:MAG: hypothetical protein KIT25_16950 [Enhydrobacter sp.]|nr:MAG: hypothetical protein KIT25_16950 [Enhydrobacter sp.]
MNLKRHSTVILNLCAFGAGVSTFFGLRSMMPYGVEGVVIPVVMALTVCFVLAMLWHCMVDVVPRLADPGRRRLGLVLAGVLTVAAMCISSWFVTTAIGGRDAVRIDMAEKTETFRRVLDIVTANAQAEQAVVPEVARTAAEMKALADGEQQRGQLSGRPGKGPVVDALRRAAATYTAVVDEANGLRERISALRTQASNQLKAMDQIIGGGDGTAEAQRKFATAVGEFRQKVAEIDSWSLLPSMRRLGLAELPAVGTGSGQNDAIAAIHATFAQRSDELTRKVDAVAVQRKEVPVIANRPIKAGEAVVEHFERVVPAWCVGIAIDAMPLLLLLVLVISALEDAAREQAQQAAGTGANRGTAEGEGRRPQLVGGDD